MRDELRAACGRVRMAMPGHKGRFGYELSPEWDNTELPVTDDLYVPSGPIRALEARWAAHADAGATVLVPGGSTAALLALIGGMLSPGDEIILPMNAHHSVQSAMVLFDLRPVYVLPKVSEALVAWVDAAAVMDAVKAHPRAKAVLITRPDYYGNVMEIAALSALCRQKGIKLLVDEAHGAHFSFFQKRQGLPESCAGFADGWVQSAHKTLPALTPGALLHLQKAEDAVRTRAVLRMVQTSSPSFLIMASLEGALERVADGKALARLVEWSRGFYAVHPQQHMPDDPTRWVVDVRPWGLMGFEAAKALARAGIDVEMADLLHVVAIPSIENTREECEAFWQGIAGLEKGLGHVEAKRAAFDALLVDRALPEQVLPPRAAALGPQNKCQLEAAEDEIAASSCGVYPPGIPFWCPGQRIRGQDIKRLMAMKEAGAELFGVEGADILVSQK